MIIKEKLEETLNQVRNQIIQDVRKQDTSVNFLDGKRDDFACLAELTFFRRSISPQGFDAYKF
jgi:hypothetical protein